MYGKLDMNIIKKKQREEMEDCLIFLIITYFLKFTPFKKKYMIKTHLKTNFDRLKPTSGKVKTVSKTNSETHLKFIFRFEKYFRLISFFES